MNTILLRRITKGTNRLYQLSRFQQPSIIPPFVSSLHVRLQSNDSYTSKAFIISGSEKKVEILSNKYTNTEVVNKVLELLGENPEVAKCETIESKNTSSRNRMISVELTSSTDVQSLVSKRDTLFSTSGLTIRKKLTPEEETELFKVLKQKRDEEPTKRWVLTNNKVANREELGTRTVVIEGNLTEEIESGSKLPALEVINTVFRILNLGHSPEIESWNVTNQQSDTERRVISVRLVNVADALNVINLRTNLKDEGKISINKFSVEKADLKLLIIEKKQKMIEDPSMFHYIYNGKVNSRPHRSLNKE